MSKRIIAGYNGSEASSEAVRWAANEAQTRGAPLRVVTCPDLPPTTSAAAFGTGAVYDAERSLAEVNAETVRTSIGESHPDVALSVAIVPGSPTSALLDGLDPDDLVVVGASSHDGAALFWVGSTTRHLAHHSPCPVVAVRGAASRGAPDRVVVGVDGSEASDEALLWAADEADLHGAELVVVHAWDYPYRPTDAESAQGHDITQVDAACTLDIAVETARERSAAAVTPMLVEGGPVDALIQTARDGDLLVVGSRGRGALRSRIFGSTANSVLDAAAVPVVIVRPDDT